jgi:hypothetical protein
MHLARGAIVSWTVIELRRSHHSDEDFGERGSAPSCPPPPDCHGPVLTRDELRAAYAAVAGSGLHPRIERLLAAGRLSSTLAHLAVDRPALLDRRRWLLLARTLSPSLRARADALAREWGAQDATYAPLAIIEILEKAVEIGRNNQ